MKSSITAATIALVVWMLSTSFTHATDVIVVCHDRFRASLKPWTDFRQQEGLKVAFCKPQLTAELTRESIAQLSQPSTRYVFLVGDAPSLGDSQTGFSSTRIPTFYLPSLVTKNYGSTSTYPSDLPYCDFDADGNTDAALGRLPIATPEQASEFTTRVLAYEQSNDFGPWRQCLQLTAGVGGFGTLVDGAIEAITRTVLTSSLPVDVKPQIAYASPGHAFCPVNESFQDCVMRRYQEGSRFWIYAGHGSVDRLDLLQRSTADSAGLREPSNAKQSQWTVESLLGMDSVSLLHAKPSRPSIGLLMACYAGAYDAPGGCLSERMLLTSGGPVAMIAASRLTMPYGNAKFGLSLLESVYRLPEVGEPNTERAPRATRIGDAFLATQKRLRSMNGSSIENSGSATQAMVDGVATLISPAGNDLNDERTEHAGLYQLLGDPTMNLHGGQTIQLNVSIEDAGDTDTPAGPKTRSVLVKFRSPVAGEMTVCVDHPLGNNHRTKDDKASPAILPGPHDPHACTVASTSSSIHANESIETTVNLPPDFSGPVVVRMFVEGDRQWASGATRKLVH